MSKEDDKELLAGLGELDWDSALDEWEKKSFVPEVARDAETNKAASTLDTTETEHKKPTAPPTAGLVPTSPPVPGTPTRPPSLGEVSGQSTVIAPVPAELRNSTRPPAPLRALGHTPLPPPPGGPKVPSPRPSQLPPPVSRGGLGQLFSRPPPRASSPTPIPPPPGALPPHRSSEKTRVASAAEIEEEVKQASLRPPETPSLQQFLEAEISSRLALTGQVPAAPPPIVPDSDRTVQAKSDVPSGLDLDSAATAVSVDRHLSQTVENPSADLADAPTVSTREKIEAPGATSHSDTLIADRAALDPFGDADTANRLPADDEMPTIGRPSAPPAPAAVPAAPAAGGRSSFPPSMPPLPPSIAPQTERERGPAPEGPTTFEEERPASRWLDDKTTAAYRLRAAWLEEEARALTDPLAMARALLAVSEICALSSDIERAAGLAMEARELAPQVALAWRQARQLTLLDPEVLADGLDAEAARSPTAAARAHATLLAADVLRASGAGDGAVERWGAAYKLDPADVRAPVARAALALAQDDYTSNAFYLSENSELIAVDRAVVTALRLRGHPRPGGEGEGEPTPINDGLRRARNALVAGDVVTTAQALTEVAADPELSKAALWLSASFGSSHIAGRRGSAKSLKILIADGDPLARRMLAARGIELGDPELVTAAMAGNTPLEAVDRAAILALAGQDTAQVASEIQHDESLAALVDAMAAATATTDEDEAVERSHRVSGTTDARAEARLGRLLAAKPQNHLIDDALANIHGTRSAAAGGVAIEAAVRGKRWTEVSEALSSLPAGGSDAAAGARHVAAALIAERAGNKDGAKRAWREAVNEGLVHDGVIRIAAALDESLDVATELLRLADDMSASPDAAVLRLEAVARTPDRSDSEQSVILAKVHEAAPSLGLGAYLAERIARRNGDLDDVLKWIAERRATNDDSLEIALDSVREALLVADRDPALAESRLEEARRARPDDVALRELFERLATESPDDRGAWREARGQKASGTARAYLFTEAALEHERAGDQAGALRAAKAAEEAGDNGLAPVIAARSEVALGDHARLAEKLHREIEDTQNDAAKREALERMAELEGGDAALEYHQRILDHEPKHKRSLRAVEHALIGTSRAEELEPIAERIAFALDVAGSPGGGEVTAHAQVAARLKMRRSALEGGGWASTRDMVRLASKQSEPSLWALRALNAHARIAKDEDAVLKTTLALLERTQRPAERAALLLRASEAAAVLEHVADARAFLEQAAGEDPGDVVTWGFLAEVRERAGETRLAAEACESLARTSVVPAHQLLAWCDAAKIWFEEVKDEERAMNALEAAAEIDVTYGDISKRLSAIYTEKKLDSELARLLEKRIARAEDEGERVALEVELARAQGDLGDLSKAKAALASALEQRPDHTTALAAHAEICAKEGDWNGAEQSYVRLARLLAGEDEQRGVYEKLAEIYSVHLNNLSRAEVAWKEVLKRKPNDTATLSLLIDIYKRQGDVARAVETQQQLVTEAADPNVRLERLIELAAIHETAGRDARKAEQVLDSARKEFPTSVVALRAMADLYIRQKQMPAMQILLDRAAGDARRAFSQGRFVPALFEVLHAAFDLRGRKDTARVVAATLAAIEGQPSELGGGDARAVDPRLDDVLAPELLTPSLLGLLGRAGDALDAVSPLDLRSLRAAPLVPGSPIAATVGSIATVVGLGAMQIFVSPTLGKVAIPLSSYPATLLVGESLGEGGNERARAFVVMRAMKMIISRSSALLRAQPDEVNALVAALFSALNPSFTPQGADPKRVQELARRITASLPRNLDPTVGVIALEAAGLLGTQGSALSNAAHAWANRVALISVGDPNAALDALAWARGEDAAPKDSEERAAWVARTPEARELMTFSVSEQYAEARMRLGLDR